MSGSLLDWFRAVYPVIVSVVSLAGFGLVLFLGTKFASKSQVEKIGEAITNHHTRLELLEAHLDADPTRQQLHEEIGALAERMSAVETGVKGIGRQLDTANNYLHTLIGSAVRKGKPK
jgi:hypothetical protein